MIVEVVFNERQNVDSPQQKSEGNPLPHCVRSLSPPQVSARFVMVKSSGTQKEASCANSSGIQSARASTTRKRPGSAKRAVMVNMMGKVGCAWKGRGYLDAGAGIDEYKRDKERQAAGQRSQAAQTQEFAMKE